MALKKDKIMLGNGFPVLPDFESMETGEATKQDIYDTQGMIAYVQKTLKADQAYTSGDSFIYNGKLYNATASISKDATIVLEGTGANAELAPTVASELNDFSLADLPYKLGKSFTGKDLYLCYHKVAALPNESYVEETVTEIPETANVLYFTAVAYDTVNGVYLQIPAFTRTGNAAIRADYTGSTRKLYVVALDNRSNFTGEFYFVYEI